MTYKNSIKLLLTVEASFCNDWPEIEIVSNDQLLWTGKIEKTQNITVEFESCETNHVVLKYLNKRKGPEVWDTVVDNDGNILQDQYCVLKQILINGAKCDWLLLDMPYYYPDGSFKDNFGFMDQIGYMEFKFPANVYQWIIDYRQRLNKPTNNQSSSLDYKNIIVPQHENNESMLVIEEVKKLLEQLDA